MRRCIVLCCVAPCACLRPTSSTIDAACSSRTRCRTAWQCLNEEGALPRFGSRCVSLPLSGGAPPSLATSELCSLTGLPLSAFVPRSGVGDDAVSQLEVGLLVVFGQCLFAWAALQDALPLRSLRELNAYELPTLMLCVLLGLTASFGIVDRLFLNERLLALLRLAVPSRREAIVRHEAGHFLLAYLLGVPLQACVLTPSRALVERRFDPGTTFLSPAIEALRDGQPARPQDVDRAAIVLMGGIAAEAHARGSAEGGAADEEALRALLRAAASSAEDAAAMEPRMAARARWAVANAVLLLRDAEPAYEALCDAMREGRTVGECAMAIEGAPPHMPPLQD